MEIIYRTMKNGIQYTTMQNKYIQYITYHYMQKPLRSWSRGFLVIPASADVAMNNGDRSLDGHQTALPPEAAPRSRKDVEGDGHCIVRKKNFSEL